MRRGRRGNATYNGVAIRRTDPKDIKAGFLAHCESCDDDIAGETQQDAWLAHRRHQRVHMDFEQRVADAARALRQMAWELSGRDDREALAALEHAVTGYKHQMDVEQPWRGEALRAGVSIDALDRACVDLGARYEYAMAYSDVKRFEEIKFAVVFDSSVRTGKHVTDHDGRPLDLGRLIEHARHAQHDAEH